MEHLTLTFTADDYKKAINEVIYLASKHQCHIEESRMTTLGQNFAGLVHISGHWNNIAKLEENLAEMTSSNSNGLSLTYKRNTPLELTGNYLPYIAQVVALDTSGIVYDVARFFMDQQIYIIDLQTDSFKTTHSDTRMLTISMRINIPAEINISELRERYMILCDELNIDGILEPEKR